MQHRAGTHGRFCRLLGCWLLAIAAVVSFGSTQADTLPCGVPSYNPASDRAIFLWRDCASSGWLMRVMGGGSYASFVGELSADTAFTRYTLFSVEPPDVVSAPIATTIRFNLQTWGNGVDGLNFFFPDGARICFSLTPSDVPILLGPARLPIRAPFDLTTQGPCGATPPPPCAVPTYDPAVDRAILLWRDCTTNGWTMRFMGGGRFATYRGDLTASAPFASVTRYSIEPPDVLQTSDPRQIQFNLQTWGNGVDGFSFVPADGASVCFNLATAGIPVLVGAARTPVAPSFDLATLGSCNATGDKLNVVVILTDDQRFDTLPFMPNVTARLVSRGVSFNNAYVPTPLCCPSRATMYSGGFLAQNTGIVTNVIPNGGATIFNDRNNVGAVLQGAGYRTLFAGKWLNQYGRLGAYIPPGWSKFVGRSSEEYIDWFSFTYTLGSSGANASTGTQSKLSGQYHSDFERAHMLDFLDNVPRGQPFFLFWSTTAPHAPATPAPGDGDLFPDYVYRGRSYGETDLSDKPLWVQRFVPGTNDNDAFVRKQLRSLQGIDRTVAAIVDKISAMGQLDRTVFIYASDNGYMWGEHGVWTKNNAFEESIKVPLVVVMPGVAPRSDDHLVSPNLDLGPTLFEIAGVSRASDGRSLVPLLHASNAPWRTELFFEKSTDEGPSGNAIWAALRREQWKYVRYWNGEEELYDLAADPYELQSKHRDPAFNEIKGELAARTMSQIGLAILPVGVFPTGRVNAGYNYLLKTWGGLAPFTWQLYSGQLPPGLTLNPSTGMISGTARTAGSYTFKVRVTDSSIATQAQKARTFVGATMTIVVNP